jgi:subtilisin family serine protease
MKLKFSINLPVIVIGSLICFFSLVSNPAQALDSSKDFKKGAAIGEEIKSKKGEPTYNNKDENLVSGELIMQFKKTKESEKLKKEKKDKADREYKKKIKNLYKSKKMVADNGYDFVDDDSDPMPSFIDSHGTHVAGTIAAQMNNAKGIVGVAPYAKIMALKTDFKSSELINAIIYAEANGAQIINASWGSKSSSCTFYDQVMYNAIADFSGLFVAAAGNSGAEHGNDYFGMPADFGSDTSCWQGLESVISVAATDQDDELTWWSDYGSQRVDVAAPGANIYSTVVANQIIFSDDFNSTSLSPNWVKEGTTDYWEVETI